MNELFGAQSLPDRKDILVRGAYVVSMDPRIGDLESGDILIRDARIATVAAEIPRPARTEVIDASGMVAMPGFVDTHWHLWNSVLRGLVNFTPERSYFPVKHALGPLFRPIDTYNSVRLGLLEALNAGITTVHNWDHNVRSPEDADANIRAHVDSGLRGRFGYGTPDGLPPSELMDLADVARAASEMDEVGDSRLSLGVVLRGPARTTEDVFTQEWAAARSMGLGISMHLGGSRTDPSRYASMEVMRQHGLLGPDVQLVHAVEANDSEIELIAATGTSLSVSPITSTRSMGFPKIGEMMRAGVLVSLSTDTLASPTNADFFMQMKVAFSVELSKKNVANLTQRRVLQMATLDGAQDLGLDSQVGSLTPGKRADLILVNASALNLVPCADPVEVIVNSGTPSNVDTVIVDGRVLKRAGLLVAHDESSVAQDAIDTLKSLCSRAGWTIPWTPKVPSVGS